MSFTWDELDLIKGKDEWRHRLPPICPTCGYNLTGLPKDRCPECGTHFDWREVRHQANYILAMIDRLSRANRDARLGLIIGLIGWAAVGVSRLPGLSSIAPVIDFIAGLAAILTLVLGAQVLKIRRVPLWARQYIGDPPPNLMLSAGAIFLGITLLLGAILLP